MNPAEFLQYLMDKAGENPNSLSRRAKVPQPTIFRFLSGSAKEPRPSTLERLAQAYGLSVELFVNEQARRRWLAADGKEGDQSELLNVGQPLPSRLIPVKGFAKMGENGLYEVVHEGAEGYIAQYSDDPDAYALQVRGQSMYPAIRSGWYVVVEPNSTPTGGEFVAIRKKNCDQMVKEFLFRTSEEIHLQSVNGQERITLPIYDVEELHPVVAVVSPRKHRMIP